MSAMDGKVSPLTGEDQNRLDAMRKWLRAHVKDDQGRGHYDGNSEARLFVVHSIVEQELYDQKNAWQLQALGLGLGDAIAEKLVLAWVMVEYKDFGRVPELQMPGKSLRMGAFMTIQKRVMAGEKVEVVPLFYAFCQEFERVKAKHGSFFGRLFRSRLV
jgi:hypothetical protein